MPEFSVSTWSLHRCLGAMYQAAEDGSLIAKEPWGPGSWNLLDVPGEMSKSGIANLEICHFHFPRTDEPYLSQLKAALDASSITLFSLLIDAGDISHPDEAERAKNMDFIRGWIDVASRLGAKNVRVIAGDAKPDDPAALQRSVEAFRELRDFAKARNVRVMTENFRSLASKPETLNGLLDQLDSSVGLCADFGNYGGESKYDDLAAILPRADSIHAKADISPEGAMDREDLGRCLKLAVDAQFKGPYTLIFEGPQEEWDGVRSLKNEIDSLLQTIRE
jgi:sugar phosphate isomerase/epimerase